MPKLRVHNVSVSLDGFAAGPAQDLKNPLGVGGEDLHTWMFRTRTGRAMFGQEGGDEGVDDDFVRAGDENIGATVMGRNMFGPVRGPWPDESWRGWWGDEPPYHHDVFVLSHHPRADLPMRGTTFHFVTDGIEAALERAFAAAGGRDVRLGGGVATIRQYLRAGLVDEMHVVVAPVLLGTGERLLGGDATAGYEVVEFVPTDRAAHYRFARSTGD
ncbi:dihydrofolate reductase family protein [Krasilnikovia sp. MM14-A1004]|uniref:dihydrofolate reductase family protein n=1 Tax=Krasilnikovia sp. MM14-A1004 TaxID=3373541 RepID=UPI00399C8B81